MKNHIDVAVQLQNKTKIKEGLSNSCIKYAFLLEALRLGTTE